MSYVPWLQQHEGQIVDTTRGRGEIIYVYVSFSACMVRLHQHELYGKPLETIFYPVEILRVVTPECLWLEQATEVHAGPATL